MCRHNIEVFAHIIHFFSTFSPSSGEMIKVQIYLNLGNASLFSENQTQITILELYTI